MTGASCIRSFISAREEKRSAAPRLAAPVIWCSMRTVRGPSKKMSVIRFSSTVNQRSIVPVNLRAIQTYPR